MAVPSFPEGKHTSGGEEGSQIFPKHHRINEKNSVEGLVEPSEFAYELHFIGLNFLSN